MGLSDELYEHVHYFVREMVNYKEKPSGLDVYFDQLFEASDRNNIEKGKLSIYDKMVRDEIQIAAERDYAVRTGREEGLEEGHAAGLEEGRVKANIETARKMKADGLGKRIHYLLHRSFSGRGGGSVKIHADTLKFRTNFRKRKPDRNHIAINTDVIPAGFVNYRELSPQAVNQ